MKPTKPRKHNPMSFVTITDYGGSEMSTTTAVRERPKRIQRKRRPKGWKMPTGAVYVGRPGPFGNPFRVTEDRTNAECVIAFRTWLTVDGIHAGLPERKAAILNSLHELRGKDLACWCPLDQPCHADVLLDIANQEAR